MFKFVPATSVFEVMRLTPSPFPRPFSIIRRHHSDASRLYTNLMSRTFMELAASADTFLRVSQNRAYLDIMMFGLVPC